MPQKYLTGATCALFMLTHGCASCRRSPLTWCPVGFPFEQDRCNRTSIAFTASCLPSLDPTSWVQSWVLRRVQGGAQELLGAMQGREETRTIPVVGEQQSPVPAPFRGRVGCAVDKLCTV